MYTVITRYIETIISYTNLKINFLQLWYTLLEPLCLITRSPFSFSTAFRGKRGSPSACWIKIFLSRGLFAPGINERFLKTFILLLLWKCSWDIHLISRRSFYSSETWISFFSLENLERKIFVRKCDTLYKEIKRKRRRNKRARRESKRSTVDDGI